MINRWFNVVNCRGFWLAILLILIAGVARSTPVDNLYESKVLAAGQDPSEQSKLIQQAFKNVLVQISGSEKILTQPTIIKAINRYNDYVTQFGYQQTTEQDRTLKVRFDEIAVNGLIQKTGQPILSKNRHSAVVWIAIQNDDAAAPQWVGGESNVSVVQQLEALAQKRGLSIIFPLLDLTDSQRVSEQTVWNSEFEVLQTAAKRYNSENMLVGKISKQPSGWYADWTLVEEEGASSRFDISSRELSVLLSETMDTFAIHLAGAQTPLDKTGSHLLKPSTEQIRLIVTGVQGAEQYVKVIHYLKTLPAVSNVEVSEISSLQAVFNIKTTVKRETLVKSIAMGQFLIENFAPNGQPTVDLTYKMAEVL